jgi:putative copper resistance protein D
MELIVVVRSIHIAAAVLLAGAFAFEFLVWPRAGQDDAPRLALSGWLRVCAAWAAAVALLTWSIWLVLIAASMSGAAPTPDVLRTVLARTNFGHVWMLRCSLGLLVGIELLSRRPGRGNAGLRTIGALAATLFLVSLAWAGHAMGSQPPLHALHLGVDALHLLGAGLWLGALPPLCFVLARARIETGQRWLAPAAVAVRNFSTLGVVAVLTILVTGVANTLFQVDSLAALLDTRYGQLVSAKIVLFLAIILIAGYNRMRLVPRIEAGGAEGPGRLAALYRNAVLEILLGGVILAVVGLLGNMAPSMHFHGPGMQHHMPTATRADLPAA